MTEIKIIIIPEIQMAGLAYLFDKEGFPIQIYSKIGGVQGTGYNVIGIHSIDRLKTRFDEIINLLEKVQTSTGTPSDQGLGESTQ